MSHPAQKHDQHTTAYVAISHAVDSVSLGDGVGGTCDVSNREGVLTYVTSASLPPARIVRGLGRGDCAKEAVSGADRRRRAQEATEVQQCRASTGDPNIAALTRANIVL